MLIKILFLCENYLHNEGEGKNMCKHVLVVESFTTYLKHFDQVEILKHDFYTLTCSYFCTFIER